MYDAKKNSKPKNEEIRFSSIYDRAYFDKKKNDNIMSTKTAYVPMETLYFE
jgi:hypothetical protein